MRDVLHVRNRITALDKRREHYRRHAEVCRDSQDWHGVQDAASDLREIEAELAALRWALGGG